MKQFVEIIDSDDFKRINQSLKSIVEYRKSGLSLNHIIGCPLDCSYCVRHLFGNFEQRIPKALYTDDEAVNILINHKYFQRDLTPIQLFNRATDPMLPKVKKHTHNILSLLDGLGLKNNVILITRWKVTDDDCNKFNSLKNIKLTVFVTYSGIDNSEIEPVKSEVASNSLKTLFKNSIKYKVVLYWRPIIPGVNDSQASLEKVKILSKHAHSIVFSGLFYRDEISNYYKENNLPELYEKTMRRKILPEYTEEKILSLFTSDNHSVPIFRKTSCGVAYVHQQADYNGHYGIKEICDICPKDQLSRCQEKWHTPETEAIIKLCKQLGATSTPVITEKAIIVKGLDEQNRYFLQHTFQYQVHDAEKPHYYRYHGRAETGWSKNDEK
ncbi:hypothetical protein [Pectobacterium brasiliense]|uniref:hypothetical protein n=1 Tax=Pectobacterium brasiliense TaxID=180957 RepID=UPI001969613B|nr:hypothetical protein [Pectobacterium brasiliense]